MTSTQETKYEHPVRIKLEQVSTFLAKHLAAKVERTEPVGKGLWSQAFFFRQANADYVLRFGNESESYEKDRISAKYSSDNLPIPPVTEIGTALGYHFAISERRTGTMIEELGQDEIESLVPAILDMLETLRQADVSTNTGYGYWNKDEVGQYSSWHDFLLAVSVDEPTSKIHGWKKSLATSPQSIEFFERMTEKLKTLASESYEGRHLVHTDLLHFNVLAENNKISAVIDWGNAMYGDFLYDFANFTFWSPLHPTIQKIDWLEKAKQYFQEKEIELPDFEKRLRVCELHIGLAGMAWNAHTKNWEELEATTKRIAELFA